jgi:hypothetical protein
MGKFLAFCVSFGKGVYALKKILNTAFYWEALWEASFTCVCMTATFFLVDISENAIYQLSLFPIHVIVGAIAYLLSLFAMKAIKKRDLELIYEYLHGRFK